MYSLNVAFYVYACTWKYAKVEKNHGVVEKRSSGDFGLTIPSI